jgi:hypothetical protein
MTYRIGAIIRNRDPYWGEPIKRITGEDSRQYYCQQGPGKYGGWDDPNYKEIIFSNEISQYRKAKFYEMICLTVLGWVVEKFKKGKLI